MVLLDEPTEWLDEASASRVLGEIRRRCRGRTLLLATHRLRQLDRFDRIAVLDAGRVLEFDTPQALLADARSRYAALRRRTVIAS